jgi:hypothetical protein
VIEPVERWAWSWVVILKHCLYETLRRPNSVRAIGRWPSPKTLASHGATPLYFVICPPAYYPKGRQELPPTIGGLILLG